MSRSAFIALCVSVLILGGFALVSQHYRTDVDQQANQAPIVASAAVPTDSPLDAPSIEASFVTTPPRVQFRQPSQERLTEEQPTLYLAFDQPIDAESLDRALQVTPTIGLDLKWTANTLYLQPVSPLTPGTTYTFTLENTATNLNGVPLDKPYRWQHLVPHRLLNAPVTPLVNRQQPLQLHFSAPIDQATVVTPLLISPTVPVTSGWNPQGDTLLLTPTIAFLPAMTYTVQLPAELHDRNGKPLAYPPSVAFTTPPLVVNAYPTQLAGAATPFTTINVGVHPPVDRAATAASFQISPTVAGSLGWHENTLIFTPTRGYLAPDTQYQVQVTPVLTDPTGIAQTTAPVAWHFATQSFTHWADFGYGPKLQSVATAGPRVIHLENLFQMAGNSPVAMPPIAMTLYPIDQATLLTALTAAEPLSKLYPLVATDELTLTARWPLTVPMDNNNYANSALTTTLPLTVPAGHYVLNLESPYVNDQLLITLTDATLILKRGSAELGVWMTDFAGKALANQPLHLYTGAGQLLAAGESDANGYYRFTEVAALTTTVATPWMNLLQAASLVVVAPTTQEHEGAIATDQWPTPNLPYSYVASPQPARRYTNALYTDRPLYTPGQTVYFKGILRRDDDAQLALPPVGTAITVTLQDARNNLVNTLTLTTNALGTVNGEFHLAEGAMVGDYSLLLEVAGETTRQPFQVQEYRKPDYQVDIQLDAPEIRAGATVTVSVASHYLSGQPVVKGQVTLHHYLLSAGGGMDGFGSPAPWVNLGQQQTGMTDATGHFTTTFVLGQEPFVYYGGGNNQGLAVEATVNDASNQSISNYALLAYQQQGNRITLDPGAMPKLPGELATFTISAHDPIGSPAAYQAMRLNVTPLGIDPLRASGVAGFDLRTDANGQLRVPFLAGQVGYYQLQLSSYDNKGFTTPPADSYLLVNDPDQPWVDAPDGLFTLRAEAPHYRPGEVANLEILSSFGEWALLTVERGQVRRSQRVALTPPRTAITLPITTTDAPNIFVTVHAWTPTTPQFDQWQSQPNYRLRTATTALTVTPLNQALTVTITADQEAYRPRTPATFQIQVTDESGAPVAAELSVALVDEAIYQLSADLTGSLFDTFYGKRPHLVTTYDAMAPRRSFGGGRGGGGGGGFDRTNPRRDFPDTAAWLPAVTTDATGQATVTLTLPDSLTSWRLVAKALTAATQVGEATQQVVTNQPVSLQPLLPAALTVGDTAVLSARLHNHTTQTQTITVTVALSPTLLVNALDLAAATTQQVILGPGTTQIVGWGAHAVAAADLHLLFTLTGDAGNDAVQSPLALRPLAIPNLVSQVGQLTGTVTLPITLPTKLYELSQVEVQLNRSLAGSMVDGLAYLTGYPYGCVEQTMSRALPNAVVGRLFAQLGVADPTLQAELPALLDASRQRLYGFQHNDGGWGWWYDDPSDAYQTAWVLFGLRLIRDAGHLVDPGVLERGSNWLQGQLLTADPRTVAFALYALSETSSLADKDNAQLRQRRDAIGRDPAQIAALDNFSLAALALVYAHDSDTEHAVQLLDQLLSRAKSEDGMVYWPIEGNDGLYQAKSMASSVRSTALALSALMRIRPSDGATAQIVRWLMAQRQGTGWGTTNETAFTLLALTDYLASTAELTATAAYTVDLNGTVVGEGELSSGATVATITLDATQLTPGANALHITSPAGQPLYYRINTRSYQAEAALTRAGELEIFREYLDPLTLYPITQTVAGQLVSVQLTVKTKQPTAYVLIEDRLPGGLEALNERLATSTHQGFDPNRVGVFSNYPYDYKEVRRERVSFFVGMMNGEWRTEYLARAVTTGTFVALPTEVYPMYDGAVWGRSASSRLVVNTAE